MTSPLNQKKIKITGPVVITANRVGDGAVVYRRADGGWTTDLDGAAIATNSDGARELIDAARLPALIAGNRQGLATYRWHAGDAELVSINALPAGAGIGTALIVALTTRLRAEGCARLWLTMTNANLPALRFYLRRGFRLVQVRPRAVDEARKLKPSIPTVGEYGIPIHDELDLCQVLDAGMEQEEMEALA